MKKSVFTKIYLNELPAFKIAEDSDNMAILDIHPLAKGHVLIFPKEQFYSIFNMPKCKFIDIMKFTKKISLCLQRLFKSKKIGLIISGFDIINHAHIHLIPANNENDLNFFNKRLRINNNEFILLQNKLIKELKFI